MTEPEAIFRFLELYGRDRATGRERELWEYQARFPDHEGVVARAFASLGDPGPESVSGAATSAGPSPEPGPGPRTSVGPYRLLHELGRGGQGVVYLAEDTRLHRRVALKVLHGARTADDETLRRFRREAEVASRLDHPGICTIFESGVDDGLPFIAMRYMEGETLGARIAAARTTPEAAASASMVRLDSGPGTDTDHEPADPDTDHRRTSRGEVLRLAALFEKLARAFHAAHEAGVIHRDVKPGNILITPAGEPVILDFGLARVEESDLATLTRTGDLFGTPAYMSPEQITRQSIRIDRRTDVWALGVCLYEAATLCRPFEAPTREALFQAILAKDPLDPRRLNPAIPRDLKVVIETSIEKDRDRRYQTALDLAEELRRVREHEPIKARAVGPFGRLLRWTRRNPAVASLLALVFFSLSGGLVATLIQKARADDNAMMAAGRADENARQAAELQLAADAGEIVALHDAAENRLWPAVPERVSEMERWISRAKDLMSRREAYRKSLEDLRTRTKAYTPAARERDRAAHPEALERLAAIEEEVREAAESATALRERLDKAVQGMRDAEEDSSTFRRAELKKEPAEEALAKLENERATRADVRATEKARFEALVAERLTWEFPDSVDQLRHDQLRDVVGGLDRMSSEPDPGTVTLRGIEKRLEFARSLRQRTIVDHAKAWDEAIQRVATNMKYQGLRLPEQLGLIPLGPDPASGFEEFCETETGEPPMRDERLQLVLTDRTAIVFVLLPGGPFKMGAQSSDSKGPNHDAYARPDESPVHDIPLAPFFLSKFELTQAQWQQSTGENPSLYAAGGTVGNKFDVTMRNPVEQVSWDDCKKVLGHLGLELPSEAQWEHGCRGGQASPWWPGDHPALLESVANVADECFRKSSHSNIGEAWNDGFPIHAPVGSFDANPFGLHDVHGNVWEWCEDGYNVYAELPFRERDGLRVVPGARHRVVRGGSFDAPAILARSAHRYGIVPSDRGDNFGVRPAKRIAGR